APLILSAVARAATALPRSTTPNARAAIRETLPLGIGHMAVRAITAFSSAPEVGLSEIDDLITPPADHGLHHVECESLCQLQGNGGRHRELCPIHDRIDQDRSVMGKRSGNPLIDLGCVFEPDAAYADRFGHACEIRVPELRAEWEEACRFLLQLDKPQLA